MYTNKSTDNTELDACFPNGTVRLVDGNATEGRVEYCYNGKWSAICNNFHLEELAVTCRQLDFHIYGGKMTNTCMHYSLNFIYKNSFMIPSTGRLLVATLRSTIYLAVLMPQRINYRTVLYILMAYHHV